MSAAEHQLYGCGHYQNWAEKFRNEIKNQEVVVQPQDEVHCSTRQQFWETGPQELPGPIFEFHLSNGEVSPHHLTLPGPHTSCPRAASQQGEQPMSSWDGTRAHGILWAARAALPPALWEIQHSRTPNRGHLMKCSTKPSWQFPSGEHGSCILRGKYLSQISVIQKSTGNSRKKISLSVVLQHNINLKDIFQNCLSVIDNQKKTNFPCPFKGNLWIFRILKQNT